MSVQLRCGFAESVQLSWRCECGAGRGAHLVSVAYVRHRMCPSCCMAGRTAQAGWAKGEVNVLQGSVRVKHSQVSKRHAELCFRKGSSAPVLHDLESRNATQVKRKTQGKQPVMTVGGQGPGCVYECAIRKGDRLSFPGQVELLVQGLAPVQVPVQVQLSRAPLVRRACVVIARTSTSACPP